MGDKTVLVMFSNFQVYRMDRDNYSPLDFPNAELIPEELEIDYAPQLVVRINPPQFKNIMYSSHVHKELVENKWCRYATEAERVLWEMGIRRVVES